MARSIAGEPVRTHRPLLRKMKIACRVCRQDGANTDPPGCATPAHEPHTHGQLNSSSGVEASMMHTARGSLRDYTSACAVTLNPMGQLDPNAGRTACAAEGALSLSLKRARQRCFKKRMCEYCTCFCFISPTLLDLDFTFTFFDLDCHPHCH